ncbi:Phospholipase D1 [Erysiphe neolycopersici]|uniref:Phospholipase D1 n=1 Tax=Erysiphe neolycopersici TaxID=212602 RepID=A0A420HB70_9PEZI|nr:Phospholipase D1 [Erysiphe neolycopersici]
MTTMAGMDGDSSSKTQQTSPKLAPVQSKRDSMINNWDQLSDKLNMENNKLPNSEAMDYVNGGKPHEPVSPTLDNQADITHKLLVLKSSHLFPREQLTDNSTSSRKSVQFLRSDLTVSETITYVSKSSHEDFDTYNKERKGQSLISKLKALTSTAGSQVSKQQNIVSSPSEELNNYTPRTPTFDRLVKLSQNSRQEDSDADADADAEETADEDPITNSFRAKKKMRFKRIHIEKMNGSQTAPTTPALRELGDVDSPTSGHRGVLFFNRRNTDGFIYQRGHFSDGDGEDQFNNHRAWRRSSHWIIGGRSHGLSGGQESQHGDIGSSFRRPHIKRAITGLGGGLSDGEPSTPKRPFLGSERATTFGAQRWRIIRQGLKMLGQKKEEHKVDYLKSAELMAELRAGAPAALMLASMVQRDEHGNKRIPVLLEQVKIQVTDSKSTVDEPLDSERHLVFRIDLEYCSGLNRMKWVIHRSLRDFANLHIRYKLQGSSDKYIQLRSDVDSRPKQPRFPKSAFPFFRGVRGLGDSDEDEVEAAQADDTAGEGTHSENEHARKKKGRLLYTNPRRKSSANVLDTSSAVHGVHQMRVYNEKQRRRLENYLQEMIRWLIFRADSNRLCRFLELSALGVRLAAEGSYHGKEGYLIIHSSKGLNTRRILSPGSVLYRHSPKWFLVRHSYIVCVDSPENIHIHDVFLVDSKFEIVQKHRKLTDFRVRDVIGQAENAKTHPKHHSLKMLNSERKIKLLAKNERQLRQFEDSIEHMLTTTSWSKPNRFASFAPVRTGIFAQWLVDGRDYMWNVSRAINMAKDVIYIHDWWLSPQLYMRRPAAISQKWRLDRLLQRKAREGVKIFIIIYRNVEAAIPIDSEFTKYSMLDLHPNIFVQRSPNQFKKNQFFYAHHEKICIVDHTVAFVGGIDLCFGRWDTPQHSVVDDKPTGFEQSDFPKDADHCQLWPGKDYSNPRVQDFYQLNEPYAEMYDRSKTPRMPWHDISMQIVGQPARDLTRHFVQRWNYVLRGRKPTRPTPFLLPPPDYDPNDLKDLGLTGTCEVQILRSASDWSLGLTETEHSIMTAYCKIIEESEHFVYMENQFFISSCETMNVKIVNKIGDAIVERAIRAHQKNESWRCIILIPLMPGFQNTVDEPEGTSVRLIMQCQFRSICRGEGSIFGRLKSHGVHPQDFVQFYSLRSWGRIGPKKVLVTEQLYIHAKAIIADDRVALIGSANVNERSMLGMRDSECAAIVRDTDMIWSVMDGKPYLVGRFAYTLRMRLMREHLGLDVDSIMEEERQADFEKGDKSENQENTSKNSRDESRRNNSSGKPTNPSGYQGNKKPSPRQKWEDDQKSSAQNEKVSNSIKEAATYVQDSDDKIHHRNALTEVLTDVKIATENYPAEVVNQKILEQPKKSNRDISTTDTDIFNISDPRDASFSEETKNDTTQAGNSHNPKTCIPSSSAESDIGASTSQPNVSHQPDISDFNPLTADIKPAFLDKDCMRDPLDDNFFEDIWRRIASNNTKIFRRVFRCNPDSEVQAWSDYRQFVAYGTRFIKEQSGETKIIETDTQNPNSSSNGKNGINSASTISMGPSDVKGVVEKIENDVLSGQNQSNPVGNGDDIVEKNIQESFPRSESQLLNNQANGDTETVDMMISDDKISISTQPLGNEAFPPLENITDESNQDLENSNLPPSRKAEHPSTASERLINSSPGNGTIRRRRRTTRGSRKTYSASDDLLSIPDCEELLSLVQGNLVNFPYDWLVKEEVNSNWLYQVDQVAPLQIYD